MPDWGHYLLRDSYFSIAQGQIGGYSLVHVTGYNPDIDSGADETVWTAGGLYPWSLWDSTRLITVVSTSNLDQGSVVVSGLDVNFNPVTEEINCAGLTPTTGTTQFKRVNSAVYKNGASNNTGVVTLTANGNTVGLIQAGIGQTLNGIYTVPAGHTAYILTGDFSVQKGEDSQVRFFVRPFGQGFRIAHISECFESTYRYDFLVPVAMTEKTDLDVQASLVETNNTRATTNFSMILVRNDAIQ
ncbi:hypothetical protein UFOVP346_58 [uncultured Caudovirales phage]|uniref:Uncharacterized protein n=1 Tax=uncultured Caudovirales phage TaxID=2100421 RepID=A0A6J5LYH8_9CAUD|nr:hypothetical protein UFOVP346_58 [uncultured Caudovirales phage]